MPFGAIIGAVAAPVIGSMIGGAMSSQPVQNMPYQYIPTNQAGMDQSYQNYFNQLGNLTPSYYGQVQPMASQALTAAYNNPYAAYFPAAAANLAGTAGNTANQQLGAANGILQSSMDPQNALYGRTLNAIQQQARAANAAAGIGTSAAGVGLENQAVNNFNIDWQNQQLQRQIQGATGAGNVGNQALNIMMGTYGLPYYAAQQVPANQFGALQSYTGTIGAYPAALNQLLNQSAAYMGMGQAAQSNAFNQAFQNAQAQNAQAAAIGQGISGAYQNYQNNQLMQNMIQNNPYYGMAPGSTYNWGGPMAGEYTGPLGYAPVGE